MNRTRISFKFLDNKNKIELELFKNTIVYGLNGKGKTRILRAIVLLQQITNENRYSDISSLIKELNIENIKINGKNYEDIFENSRIILKKRDEIINEFIQEENDALRYYLNIIEDVIPRMLNSTPMSAHRRIDTFIVKGKEILENKKQEFNEFNEWLNVGKNLIRTFFRVSNQNIFSDRDDFDELSIKKNFLINFEKFREIEAYINNKFDRMIRDFEFQSRQEKKELENEKIQVKKIFENLKVKFIPAYHENEDVVFFELINQFRKINENILYEFWDSNKNNNQHEKSQNILKDKLKKLNNLLEAYGKIEIILDGRGYVIRKNNQDIDFSKLSSGERRILSIMINVMFSDSSHVLIDEPELSMSLDYQNRLVIDLLSTCSQKVLIMATHAPYIYKDFKNFPENRVIQI